MTYFSSEFCQSCERKGNIIVIPHILLKKIEGDKICPDSVYKASITPIPNPGERLKEKSYKLISFMNNI